MDRKLTLVLALLVLAAVSVSIVTAGDGSQDVISADDSDEPVKEGVSVENDKISESNDEVLGDYNGFTIKVAWDDSDDAKGKRPDSVQLSVDIRSDVRDVDISKDDSWQMYIDEGVEDGDVKITAPNVSGYTAKVSGNEKDGFTVTFILDDKEDSNSTSSDDKTSGDGSSHDKSSDDNAPVKKTSVKKKTTTTTKTVKKQPKKTNETKKIKDKNNTGNPILLGVLAVSAAGLAYSLRRRE